MRNTKCKHNALAFLATSCFSLRESISFNKSKHLETFFNILRIIDYNPTSLSVKMTFNTLKSAILLVILIVFASCKKDSALPSSKNSIKLNGESFSFSAASIFGISIDGEGHAGITFTSVSGTNSKSLAIDFEYFADKAIEGYYTFPQTNSARYLDDWLTTYTEMSMTETVSTHLESGTLDLTHNGDNNYTVIIDLIMTDGKVFEGTYTGDFIVQFQNNKKK